MPRAAKISEEQWEKHRETILALYKEHTLAEVVSTLARHPYHFPATRSQYPPKLQQWGVTKYGRSEIWQYVAWHLKRRHEEGLASEVLINGETVPDKKVRKELSRLHVSGPPKAALHLRAPEGVLIRTPASNTTSTTPREHVLTISESSTDSVARTIQYAGYLKGIRLPSIEAAEQITDAICNFLWNTCSSFMDTGPTGEKITSTLRETFRQWQLFPSDQGSEDLDVSKVQWLQKNNHELIRSAVESTACAHRMLQAMTKNSDLLLRGYLIESIYQLALANEKLINDKLDTVTTRALYSWIEEMMRHRDLLYLHMLSLWTPKASHGTQNLLHVAISTAIKNKDMWVPRKFYPTSLDLDDPIMQEGKKVTLLHIASRQSETFFLSELLRAGCKPNPATLQIDPPLIDAIKASHLESVQILLGAGAFVSGTELRGLNPLTHAIKKMNRPIINELLNWGADVNLVDRNLGPPLSQAAKHRNVALVQILLQRGADLNWPFTFPDLDSVWRYPQQPGPELLSNPLQNAILARDGQMVEILTFEGAIIDPLPLELSSQSVRDDMGRYIANTSQSPLLTPLQAAVTVCDRQLAERLLNQGASPDGRAFIALDETPLQTAARLGDLEMVKTLLHHGANVNAPAAHRHGGCTAIQYAIESGNRSVLRFLLDAQPILLKTQLEIFEFCIERNYSATLIYLFREGWKLPLDYSTYRLLSRLVINEVPSSVRNELFSYLLPVSTDLDLLNFKGILLPLLLVAGQMEDISIVKRVLRCASELGNSTIEIRKEDVLHFSGESQLRLISLLQENDWELTLSAFSGDCLAAFQVYLNHESEVALQFVHGHALLAHDIRGGDHSIVTKVLSSTRNLRRVHSLYRMVILQEAARNGAIGLLKSLLEDCYDNDRWLWNHAEILEATVLCKENKQSSVLGNRSEHESSGEILLSALAAKRIPLQPGKSLQIAAYHGNWNMVEMLLSEGMDPNEPLTGLAVQKYIYDDEIAVPPLTYMPALSSAIIQDRHDMVFKLLDAGADVSPGDIDDDYISDEEARLYPIEHAVKRNSLPLVEKLLSSGTAFQPLSAEDYLDRAMFEAMDAGHTEIVKRLLQAGATCNYAYDLGDAIDSGRLDVVALVLHHAQRSNQTVSKERLDKLVEYAYETEHYNLRRYIESWRSEGS